MTPHYPDLKNSVIICVIFLVFQIYISLFAAAVAGSKGVIILTSVVVPPLLILGIAAHMNRTTLKEILGWGRVRTRTIIPVILMTVSLAFIISEVENIAIRYLIPADLYQSYLKQFMDIFFFEQPADLVLGLASIALVGPFMEEAVFRGVIFRGISSHRGASYAVVASSVLFMVVHVNPLQFPGALILGLIYSTMISRGYGIADTITAHSLHNAISLLFLFEVVKLPGMNLVPGGTVDHVSIWIVAVGAIVFAAAFSLIIRWAPGQQMATDA
ncbi:MAG: CPBP family intramembrane metalloprotease [Deltaproteobacteria bacterium]|nr:CPBP family intramembrane metalloprotease [Candidatus Zymogenaceae bacterium]